jgi:hypothetical protein
MIGLGPDKEDPLKCMVICCEFGRDASPSVGRMPRRRGCRRSAHNLPLPGPPGAGQSRLARRPTTILPAMRLAEAIETPHIHRVAGHTGARTAVVTTRPSRATPHTISDVGLIGGGQVPLPGEVSLAHNGVLFLDEWPEFRRHVLEVLRQPLEKSIVYIQSPARHRPRRAGCDRRAARDTNQIAGTMVVPDKDALA